LQFGNPEKPEVFWSFRKAVNAIIEFCESNDIPVVGGKVSFYNETNRAPIKPTPVIGAFGFIQKGQSILDARLKEGDTIFVVGQTSDELGGSEYYEFVHQFTGGNVPLVDIKADRVNRNIVLNLINKTKISCVHDCSKGGLATAISEMAILGRVGFELFVDKIPNSCSTLESALFSESHSRFLIGTQRPEEVENYLSEVNGLVFSRIGRTLDNRISFWDEKTSLIDTDINILTSHYNIIERIMTHGQDN
jgi:phosphoribosylformylglycinamidine synthase